MPDAPVIPLTVFLIRGGVTDPARILRDLNELDHFEVRTSRGFLGLLYVRPTVTKTPQWVKLFEGSTEPKRLLIRSSSPAAILIIQQKKNAYALTFGHGRGLLAPGVMDGRFGLRVTLNAINPDKIRSIDRRTFDAISRHTREQVSRDSGVEAFGLDIERDLLRAVTGTPADVTLGKRLTGMDALATSISVTLNDLPDLLARFQDLSERPDYRKAFPWVDNLAEVRDPHTISSLNESVVKLITKSKDSKIWLVPPDIIDWADVGGVAYHPSKTATVDDDLSLDYYLEARRKRTDVTVDRLKDDRVFVLSASGGGTLEWSIWSCLTAEVQTNKGIYVLSDATWYRVATEFADEVDQVIAKLPTTAVPLQPFNDKDEDAYNLRMSRKIDGLALMHGQFIPASARRKAVELCDLYSLTRVLVHVKRDGPSAVLSHMFAQGVVSARLLFSDSKFRHEANKKLPPSHRLADPEALLNARDFEVAYAVVQRAGKTPKLPFFSRVNLRTSCDALSGWGFKVSLTLVN